MSRKRDKWLKMLVYGAPKVGKTTFAVSAADDARTAPILILDTEGGLDSVDNRELIDIEYIQDSLNVNYAKNEIPVFTIRQWTDYQAVRDFLNKEEHPFNTVILDSITEANEIFFLNRLSDATAASGRRQDENISEIQDFQVIHNQMGRVLRTFVHLPMHVVMTAHDRIGQKHGKPHTAPKLVPSNLATSVAGMCNQVVYLDFDDVNSERMLLVQNYADMLLGGRYGMLTFVPDEIYEPTVTDMLDILNGLYEIPYTEDDTENTEDTE